MTLTEFLRERLDEDDYIAGRMGRAWPVGVRVLDGAQGWTYTLYAINFQPERMLAEVAAKRRIVEEASEQAAYLGSWESVLHWLAQPYADHPDYREEWRV